MFGFRGHKVVTATIGTDGSISTAVDIRNWNHVAIECPTFAVGVITATANIKVFGAKTSSDTFRVIKDEGAYSAGVEIGDWEVPSSTGNYTVVCRPAARFDYIKVQCSNTCTANMQIAVHLHN